MRAQRIRAQIELGLVIDEEIRVWILNLVGTVIMTCLLTMLVINVATFSRHSTIGIDNGSKLRSLELARRLLLLEIVVLPGASSLSLKREPVDSQSRYRRLVARLLQ